MGLKIAILLSCVIVTFGQPITVNGYAYLEGETDHESIEIVFERTVPSTVFDTALTNSSGYFSINLETGIYDVSYRQEGFLPVYLTDIVLYSSTTLPDTVLGSMGLFGALSGTLAAGTYTVGGDIEVLGEDSLTIEPGAKLCFREGVGFDVRGYLIAEGTEYDSIIFTSLDTASYWRGIDFYYDSLYPPVDSSKLSHCVVEYADGGLYIRGLSPVIQNCLIRNNLAEIGGGHGGGILLIGSNSLIENTTISNNHANSEGGGIRIEEGNPIVRSCIIESNSSGLYGAAINCKDSGLLLENSLLLYNSPPGLLTSTTVLIDDCPDLIAKNVTICHSNCIAWVVDLNSGNFINCIIANNEGYGIRGSGFHIQNCDFWNNSDGNFHSSCPEWLGVNVTINANGDSIDPYGNIQLNPMFVDTASDDFRLLPESPCLDAGAEFMVISDDTIWAPLEDFDGATRPYGPRWDIGAFEGPFTGIEEKPSAKPEAFAISAYPNPFNSAVTITAPAGAEVEVFDVNGRYIKTLRPSATSLEKGGTDSAPLHKGGQGGSYIWQPGDNIGSGVYLVRATVGGEGASRKIIYLK